jgi:prolyl-tRNA synthetase
MRMSKLVTQTLREAPSDATVASHKLLVRAGFIRQLAAGIFTYMPLANRSLVKIENIMREEMNAIGGQEITMPVVHPADLWKETLRWYQIGSEMGRFKDRSGHDMVLAMTHEEVIGDLVRQEVRSYRQLPLLLYHIQTKWRDDPRPRAGLMRVREFTMKDSYSLDANWQGLDTQYRAHYQAYFNIFHRCGLPVAAVKSDVGMMGGTMAHEFMYLTPIGEDTLLICGTCGYMANRQIAMFQKPHSEDERPKALEKIATPNVTTIEELAKFLGVPESKTAKAVFMVATIAEGDADIDRFVFAMVRGDMDVNETKLANAIGAKALRPAQEDEIRAAGAEPGYGSPIGLKGAIVVVDDSIPNSPNLVAGANVEGYHSLNVNYGRDYQADVVCDIAAAKEGDACPKCTNPMYTSRGVEVGNIFKLGTRYSDSMGCSFLDRDGQSKPIIMGSYGIGSGRVLACIAEEHHDENGLIWPVSVAPYQVHLVALMGRDKESLSYAFELYEALLAEGIEVLFDDRDESPGVKFMDADLIGLPVRLTVSPRTLSRGQVELKLRKGDDASFTNKEKAVSEVQRQLAFLWNGIQGNVRQMPFDE